ncbi:nucleotidyltransferase family protein [Candidatus Pelagibacter bacterium]|nr:nucleotidyltransferase family protein [Candidatus Pelagibacter bacterium]
MRFYKKKEIANCLLKKNATIKEAILNLSKSAMQISMIVDKNSLIGVLTDGDIRRALLKGFDLNDKIENIIKKNPLLIKKSSNAQSASILMSSKALMHLPVVNNDNSIFGLYAINDYKIKQIIKNPIIIMAGGLGKRLRPYTNSCPKPMLKILGKPILEHIINNLVSQGFRDITISVNYLANNIISYFGNGKKFDANINYIKEKKPLGTIGSLSLFKKKNIKPVFVINADTLTNIDLSEMLNFHIKNKADATMASKVLTNSNPYGVVQTKGIEIVNFKEKPIDRIYINAGIYIFSQPMLKNLKKDTKKNAPEFFLELKKKNKKIIIFPAHEEWKEIGTLENFKKFLKKNEKSNYYSS